MNLGNEHCEWYDVLIAFLKHSNENSCYQRFFMDHFDVLEIPGDISHVRWIDLGCGDGSKSIEIGKSLRRLFKSAYFEIEFIDRDTRWAPFIEKNVERLAAFGNISCRFRPISISAFLESYDFRTEQRTLFTHIQVLYSTEHMSDMKRLVDRIIDSATIASLVIGCEAQESDVARIRRELRASNCPAPFSKLDQAIAYFREKDVPIKKFTLSDKMLRLDFSEVRSDTFHWFYPFVMGISRNSFARLPENMLKTIRGKILDYLDSRNSGILTIPDDVIAVRFGKGTISER